MGVFRPLFSANTQDMFLYTERIRNFGARKIRIYVFVVTCRRKFRSAYEISTILHSKHGSCNTKTYDFVLQIAGLHGADYFSREELFERNRKHIVVNPEVDDKEDIDQSRQQRQQK